MPTLTMFAAKPSIKKILHSWRFLVGSAGTTIAFAPTLKSIAEGTGIVSAVASNLAWWYSLPDENWFQIAWLVAAAWFVWSAANEVRVEQEAVDANLATQQGVIAAAAKLEREEILKIPMVVIRATLNMINVQSAEQRARCAQRYLEEYTENISAMRQRSCEFHGYKGRFVYPNGERAMAEILAAEELLSSTQGRPFTGMPAPALNNALPYTEIQPHSVEKPITFAVQTVTFEPDANLAYFAAHDSDITVVSARLQRLDAVISEHRAFATSRIDEISGVI